MNQDWRNCSHNFQFYFGPVMTCRLCGASTIASVDGKSKPIFPPAETEWPSEETLSEEQRNE